MHTMKEDIYLIMCASLNKKLNIRLAKYKYIVINKNNSLERERVCDA